MDHLAGAERLREPRRHEAPVTRLRDALDAEQDRRSKTVERVHERREVEAVQDVVHVAFHVGGCEQRALGVA